MPVPSIVLGNTLIQQYAKKSQKRVQIQNASYSGRYFSKLRIRRKRNQVRFKLFQEICGICREKLFFEIRNT